MRDRLTLGPPGTAGERLAVPLLAWSWEEAGRGAQRQPLTHPLPHSFQQPFLQHLLRGAEDSQPKTQPQVGAQWGRKQDKRAPPRNPAHIQAGPSSGPLAPLARPACVRRPWFHTCFLPGQGQGGPARSPRQPRAQYCAQETLHKCSGAVRMNRHHGSIEEGTGQGWGCREWGCRGREISLHPAPAVARPTHLIHNSHVVPPT